MHHDSFYIKGQRHLTCQDYAWCESDYGIVSDGCSSVANTDLGARFLVLSAKKHRHHFLDAPQLFYKNMMEDAIKLASESGSPLSVLHATLGMVVPTETHFEAMLCGDGFLVARKRDGGLKVIEVDYDNMPYYPLYSELADPENQISEKEFEPSIKTMEIPRVNTLEVSVKQSEFQKFFLFSFPKDEFDLVAVTTDGLGKFVQLGEEDGKPVKHIPPSEVAFEIFQKATQDEHKRFFGVQALEDGLNGLVDRYDRVGFMDDFAFAMFLDA